MPEMNNEENTSTSNIKTLRYCVLVIGIIFIIVLVNILSEPSSSYYAQELY